MPSVSALDIFRSAKHGRSAGYYAAGRATTIAGRSRAAVWRHIVKAIETLLAMEPSSNVH